jgi:hypothetical protein
VAFLARSNGGVFVKAASLAMRGARLYFVGGEAGYNLSAVRDVALLAEGTPAARAKISTPLLLQFSSVAALAAYARRTHDVETTGRLNLLQAFGAEGLHAALDAIRRATVTDAAAAHTADVLLSTVHKAKGLEFDEVVLGHDFKPLRNSFNGIFFAGRMLDLDERVQPLDARVAVEEVNLLYVAMTRAKKRLWLHGDAAVALRLCGGWSEYGLRLAAAPCGGQALAVRGVPSRELQVAVDAVAAASGRPAASPALVGPALLCDAEHAGEPAPLRVHLIRTPSRHFGGHDHSSSSSSSIIISDAPAVAVLSQVVLRGVPLARHAVDAETAADEEADPHDARSAVMAAPVCAVCAPQAATAAILVQRALAEAAQR